jgi:hypothetical protein
LRALLKRGARFHGGVGAPGTVIAVEDGVTIITN